MSISVYIVFFRFILSVYKYIDIYKNTNAHIIGENT